MRIRKILTAILTASLIIQGSTPVLHAEQIYNVANDTDTAESTASNNFGYIDSDQTALSIHDENEATKKSTRALLKASSIPTAYSSVDEGYVTSVKNQGSFGTCWAFAAVAAMESSLLANNQASIDDLDLSERHLIYFTYNTVADSLGNTAGDTTTSTDESYLEVGGTSDMPSYILSSWLGTVDEDNASYSELEDIYESCGSDYTSSFYSKSNLSDDIAYEDDNYHVEQVRQIATSDTDELKQAIIDYGAAAIAVYYTDSYLNSNKTALYNGEKNTANHAVTVVGWDDDYSRNNFDSSNRPDSNGAWLIKNSWGTSYNKSGWSSDTSMAGYFWLSYEDIFMNSDYSYAYVYELGTSDNYDNIYQYDGTASTKYNYVKSGGSIANIYEANGNSDSSGYEQIEAVSFYLSDVNVNYSIQIYVNPTSGTPNSGKAMLDTPITGQTTYTGYYTVDIPSPAVISEGSTYSVVVKFTKNNGDRIKYYVDSSYTESTIKYENTVSAGQSYEKYSSKKSWHDLSDSSTSTSDNEKKCSARLKAFTSNISEEAAENIYEYTAPTAVEDLIYNGDAQTLISAGSTEDSATMYYAVNQSSESCSDSLYATTLPTATDAGTYYVWYKVIGNETYNETEANCIKVTISKAALTDYEKPSGITAYVGQTLADVSIPETSEGTWSWNDETESVGDVGEHSFSATLTPTNTNYYTVSDELTVTVKDVDTSPLSAVISEAESYYSEISGNDNYDEIAADLKEAIDTANLYLASDTLTSTIVERASSALETALNIAKQAVAAIDATQTTASPSPSPTMDADNSDSGSSDSGSSDPGSTLNPSASPSSDSGNSGSDGSGGSGSSDDSGSGSSDGSGSGSGSGSSDGSGSGSSDGSGTSASDGSNSGTSIDSSSTASNGSISGNTSNASTGNSSNNGTSNNSSASSTSGTSVTNAELEAAKNNAYIALSTGVKVIQKGQYLIIKWNKASLSDGYKIYVSYLGNESTTPIKVIETNLKTRIKIKKIAGKKINFKKILCVYVEAYKNVNNEQTSLSTCEKVYLVGSKNSKYTNAKKIKITKQNLNIQVAKSLKIKAKVTLANKNKKHLPAKVCSKLRYRTSNSSVATVDTKGRVTGVSVGTCTIYTYTANGLVCEVAVTVQ
ncbi:MAG: Ig-like domain-containing protein [Lachnospiraceae bacterium]|nr:Ig-like domain-containing protein [Lachnospiraceae bacterium]